MAYTSSLNYKVWATSWTIPTQGLGAYPALVPLLRPTDDIANSYVRVPSDTSGLDNVPWNYYYNLVQQIPVGRRVYYGHFWQDDGMTVFRNRTDYYKLRRDGTTYGDQPSETVTGFGDSNPLKYTSIWGLSAAADGKISFKNFLQKCNTFGVTFDYYWDDTESHLQYDLMSVYCTFAGSYDANGIPIIADYLDIPDPRRTPSIVNDFRFSSTSSTYTNINGRSFSQEFLQKYKDTTDNQSETRTSQEILSFYTNVTNRQDFKAPWGTTNIYAAYAWSSSLFTYNFGTLKKKLIHDSISEMGLNIKVMQSELFPVNKDEAKYATDLNNHYFIKDAITGYNVSPHLYGDIAQSIINNYGYKPAPINDYERYTIVSGGTSLGPPAYWAFVKELRRLRGIHRSNNTAYQNFTPIISTPYYSGEDRKLHLDIRYWYELMYHACLHGAQFFNLFVRQGEDTGFEEIQVFLDEWKRISENNTAIPASNSSGNTSVLVDRINLEEAATRGIISGGYIPSIGKWIWRLTATPTVNSYTLADSTQTDLPLNIEIASNTRGTWIVRSVPGRPNYLPGYTENGVTKTPPVIIEAKPTIVSKSPMSKTPYNSRILIKPGDLSPNPLVIGSPITSDQTEFQQKFNKVFDYLIARYEPYWVGVDDVVGKLQARNTLGISGSQNPFGTENELLFRYAAYNSTEGWFDPLTHPKQFANAVKSAYVPFERARVPQNANQRFINDDSRAVFAVNYYYNQGGGSNTFFGLAPNFFWYPDNDSQKFLTANYEENYQNKIVRTLIRHPYGKFETVQKTSKSNIGTWRSVPWMTRNWAGDHWRFDQYLLLREKTTFRDLLTNPATVRDSSLGVLVNGVPDVNLNTVYSTMQYPAGYVATDVDYARAVGHTLPVTIGSPWVSYPNGITWSGGWWGGSSPTLNFNERTMLNNDGSTPSTTPPTLNNSITSQAGIPSSSLTGLSYGYGEKVLQSLNNLSADWADKIEFIAYIGNLPYGPIQEYTVPWMLYKDPNNPTNVQYFKWRLDASVSHWKEKFKSPFTGFANVVMDASAPLERTFHQYQAPGYTAWKNINADGISFAENIPVSWIRDQYNYTRGLSANPDKGVIVGIETFGHYMFKHDAYYLDPTNTEQSRYPNDPAPRHWCLDNDKATPLYTRLYNLVIGQRRWGKEYTNSIWKRGGSNNKDLGEIFSVENPLANGPQGAKLDAYPFFWNCFIENVGGDLRWKTLPGTNFNNSGGIPWNRDRRFRLFFLYPTVLALNASIVDYFHCGTGYYPVETPYGDGPGWFDIKLGNTVIADMETNGSYPVVANTPQPNRKTPMTPAMNYWTGNKDTSEFELLYACMKAGITTGLDSLGFTDLYNQL